MTIKHLRCEIEEVHFKRFKMLKVQMGADTNDEALVKLMDAFEELKELEDAVDEDVSSGLSGALQSLDDE